MIIGGGKTPNYPALALFLPGSAVGGVAVYYVMVGGRWLIPTVLSLLLMFVGMGLVAAKKDEG